MEMIIRMELLFHNYVWYDKKQFPFLLFVSQSKIIQEWNKKIINDNNKFKKNNNKILFENNLKNIQFQYINKIKNILNIYVNK